MTVRRPLVVINGTIAELPATDSLPAGSQSTTGFQPVVTGEVPPILVYLDDGSLLYAEIA